MYSQSFAWETGIYSNQEREDEKAGRSGLLSFLLTNIPCVPPKEAFSQPLRPPEPQPTHLYNEVFGTTCSTLCWWKVLGGASGATVDIGGDLAGGDPTPSCSTIAPLLSSVL